MKIGSRIFKTAIGAGLAMYIAQLIGLNFYGSAGIITILCIETTKVRSFNTSINRALASLLALVVGGVLFQIAGYNPLTFSILILLFLPLLIKLNLNEGFITSVVILLHIYSLGKMSVPIVVNEVLLIVIGSSVALLLNSFMPNLQKELSDYQEQIESRFKKILYEYAMYLENGDQGWSGKEIFELETIFKEAKSLAIRNIENHLMRRVDRPYNYFEMRGIQFELLRRMLPTISRLDEKVPQRTIFAKFLRELSLSVKEENTAYKFIEQLNAIRKDMRELPLPETREEFETRASLFHLMNEMARYLEIKQNAKLVYEESEKIDRKKTRSRS